MRDGRYGICDQADGAGGSVSRLAVVYRGKQQAADAMALRVAITDQFGYRVAARQGGIVLPWGDSGLIEIPADIRFRRVAAPAPSMRRMPVAS